MPIWPQKSQKTHATHAKQNGYNLTLWKDRRLRMGGEW
jgi:hypothetical protein